jgi:hypothetical protein
MNSADPLWRGAPVAVKSIQPDGIAHKTLEENEMWWIFEEGDER